MRLCSSSHSVSVKAKECPALRSPPCALDAQQRHNGKTAEESASQKCGSNCLPGLALLQVQSWRRWLGRGNDGVPSVQEVQHAQAALPPLA